MARELSEEEKLRINELLWKAGSVDFAVFVLERLIRQVKENVIPRIPEEHVFTKPLEELFEITNLIHEPFRKEAEENNWFKHAFDRDLANAIVQELIGFEEKNRDEILGGFEKLE